MKKTLFLEQLKKNILVFDGAMGSNLQDLQLPLSAFGGKDGCNDCITLFEPEIIERMHASFLEVGCDILTTNTFGSNRLKLEEYGLGDRTYELNRKAAELALKVAARYSTPEKPRFVAGDIGPSGMLPSSTDPDLGQMTVDELEELFYHQAQGLVDGGVDLILIETAQDIAELRAQLFGVRRYLKKVNRDIPIICQITLDPNGRMLLGTDIAAAMTTLEAAGADIIGLNCSTGPEEMRESVRFLGENCSRPVSVEPNAGIPRNEGGKAVYPATPESLARHLKEFVTEFGVDIVGGCCGTTPAHLRAVVEAVRGLKPSRRRKVVGLRNGPQAEPMPVSGLTPAVSSAMRRIELHQEPRPLIVGERINSQGSRKVKELLLTNDYESILKIARQQVDNGAHVLDVCVALTERSDELGQMTTVVKLLAQSIESPLMIDSTEAEVIHAALKVFPGRAIINSVNLEKGGHRMKTVMPLAQRYGAPVIAMCIDEQGMAITRERKLEVARNIHRIVTGEYAMPADCIIFDPLTFTLATGEKEYQNSAVETIEGIRTIKKELPGTMTSLGVSNVSFGLTPPARKVLNSVFLYHAVQAGLDLAMVNPADIRPYAEISADERKLADDLVFNRTSDALAAFIAHFEKQAASGVKTMPGQGAPNAIPSDAPLERRIQLHIINRVKEGIEELLSEALKTHTPVNVINSILLPAMKEVGDRFATGELILPFVLQSAEVMKKAVAYIEQFLEKTSSYAKGRMVLATVYGDVHDIGKNLVKTILTNNGFEVHDLGKQVPLNTIIEKAVELKADAIGLSALLVSTSKQQQLCVQELHKRGLSLPVLVGGAAINRNYGRRISFVSEHEQYSGGVYYCKDAFEGLDVMNKLASPEAGSYRKKIFDDARVYVEQQRSFDAAATSSSPAAEAGSPTKVAYSKIRALETPPKPPFWGTRLLTDMDLMEVFPLMDTKTLFTLSWGVRARSARETVEQLIEEEYKPLLLDLQLEAIEKEWFEPKVLYGYFPCQADANDLIVYRPDRQEKELMRFTFPRQKGRDLLCLADYFRRKTHDGRKDTVAFQLVTVGHRATEVINQFSQNNEYTKALYLNGLANSTAEGLAEWAHQRVRRELGIGDGVGKRYSPGYPVWPELADQVKLFQLLDAERQTGVGLTEAFQMNPEQSTSAIVIHHPECTYFTVTV